MTCCCYSNPAQYDDEPQVRHLFTCSAERPMVRRYHPRAYGWTPLPRTSKRVTILLASLRFDTDKRIKFILFDGFAIWRLPMDYNYSSCASSICICTMWGRKIIRRRPKSSVKVLYLVEQPHCDLLRLLARTGDLLFALDRHIPSEKSWKNNSKLESND